MKSKKPISGVPVGKPVLAGPPDVMKPKGIAIPIYFSTNKLSRRTATREPRPVTGYIELYFAPRPVDFEEIDLLEPGRTFHKAEALYRKHHAYGDHRFLIPTTHKTIEKYEASWNMRFAFMQIADDPTTATYQEALQLLPCSRANLGFFKEKLQTEPFYIEVAAESFILHIRTKAEHYVALPAQAYSPRCWHEFAHPVVSLETQGGSIPYFKFCDIPWQDLAEQIWL
jgi:hypothetical protein